MIMVQGTEELKTKVSSAVVTFSYILCLLSKNALKQLLIKF